jgi:hypothetical protein
MKREHNDRKHPGVRGKRPDLKKLKQSEAKERQKFYDGLSVKEKLEHITRQLAKIGGEAKKQIQKLLSIVETKNKSVEVVERETDDVASDAETKRVKAKDRRKAQQQ